MRGLASQHFNEVLRALMVTRVKLEMMGEAVPVVKYAEVMGRDGARFDCRHGMDKSPFSTCLRPGGEANATLADMLCQVLGADAEVCQFGQIVALTPDGWAEHGGEAGEGNYGGGDDDTFGDQAWHTDGRNALKPGQRAEAGGVATALTLFIPLVDVTLENGPTQFCLGTHRRGVTEEQRDHSAISLCLPAGSAVAFDFRLWHRGMRNESDRDRPMLYAIVGRPVVFAADDGTLVKGLPQLDSARASLFSAASGKSTSSSSSSSSSTSSGGGTSSGAFQGFRLRESTPSTSTGAGGVTAAPAGAAQHGAARPSSSNKAKRKRE